MGRRDVRATRVTSASTCEATGKVRVPAAREAGMAATGPHRVASAATSEVRATATAASAVSAATTTPTVALGAGRHRSPHRDRGDH
jgi:hypothetical protein